MHGDFINELQKKIVSSPSENKTYYDIPNTGISSFLLKNGKFEIKYLMCTKHLSK